MLHYLVALQIIVMDRVDEIKNNERGATAVEYGLMVALIAAVIVVAVKALGSNVSTKFSDTCKAINNATACP